MFDAIALSPFSATIRGSFRKAISVKAEKMENKRSIEKKQLSLQSEKSTEKRIVPECGNDTLANNQTNYSLNKEKALEAILDDATKEDLTYCEKDIKDGVANCILIDFNTASFALIMEYTNSLQNGQVLATGMKVKATDILREKDGLVVHRKIIIEFKMKRDSFTTTMHIYHTNRSMMIQGAKRLEDGSSAAEYHALKVAIPYFKTLIANNKGKVRAINDALNKRKERTDSSQKKDTEETQAN